MHGLALAEVLVEEGVSGSIPVEERPVGGALFARLQKGDIVIAAKLDRLFRSALDALKVVESLKTRGVKLHLLDLGGDIAGNGLSKLFLTIAAAFAEAERDRIRERIGQVKADQKASGRYLGGKIPFGLRLGDDGELVQHEAEQEAIREMVALRAEGKPLRAIAAEMQEISATWACRVSYASDGPLEGDRQDDRGDGKSTDRRAAIKPCSVGSDAHVECCRTSAFELAPPGGTPVHLSKQRGKNEPRLHGCRQ